MMYFKQWSLIGFCILVSFLYSKNLPQQPPSLLQYWTECNSANDKIESGEVSVLSYNTWGLPISLYGHDQDYRFTRMSDSLALKKGDIIALQETFHPDLRHNLLGTLCKIYHTYSDYRCTRNTFAGLKMDCTGGLMTFSSFPIIDEKFYPFPIDNTYSLVERMGKKGFLVSHIQYGKKRITVINTHFYAGHNDAAENIRLQQIKYIHEVLNSNNFLVSDQSILLGDFNINHPDVACSKVYDYITQNMAFADSKPHILEKDFTYSSANHYCNKNTPSTKLDYVFLKNISGGNIISQSRIFDTDTPLSDHYGWQINWKI